MNLIQSAKNTGLGKEYDYASINSYTTFAERFLSVRMKNSNPWSNAHATGNKIYFGNPY
jgi:hypothetical protein